MTPLTSKGLRPVTSSYTVTPSDQQSTFSSTGVTSSARTAPLVMRSVVGSRRISGGMYSGEGRKRGGEGERQGALGDNAWRPPGGGRVGCASKVAAQVPLATRRTQRRSHAARGEGGGAPSVPTGEMGFSSWTHSARPKSPRMMPWDAVTKRFCRHGTPARGRGQRVSAGGFCCCVAAWAAGGATAGLSPLAAAAPRAARTSSLMSRWMMPAACRCARAVSTGTTTCGVGRAACACEYSARRAPAAARKPLLGHLTTCSSRSSRPQSDEAFQS